MRRAIFAATLLGMGLARAAHAAQWLFEDSEWSPSPAGHACAVTPGGDGVAPAPVSPGSLGASGPERAWWAWFRSQPGGPFELPESRLPAAEPAFDAAWLRGSASLATGPDGLARIAHAYGGAVYLAQRVPGGSDWAWRHERVADSELEWPRLALAMDSRGRAQLVFEAAASGGRELIHAARETHGLWALRALPARASESRCFDLRLRAGGRPFLSLALGTELWTAELASERWELERVAAGLADDECPSLAIGPQDEPGLAWVDRSRRLMYASLRPSGWESAVVTEGARRPALAYGERPWVCFEDARLGRFRLAGLGARPFPASAQAAFPAPQPAQARGLFLALAVAAPLLAWRLLLAGARRRSRRLFRSEAALIGAGECLEVLVRSREHPWRPASAGLVLVSRRATVLWVQGLSPAEAWLSHGWRLTAGRPGWVEAACGPARFELALDPGVRAWPRRADGRRLLELLRPAREPLPAVRPGS
ncbi:MAG: hypothetical protein HY554_14300 [Elusimicrobia bacterium]|nr:hypothetical protein [Elusimicrobiota bacterium]